MRGVVNLECCRHTRAGARRTLGRDTKRSWNGLLLHLLSCGRARGVLLERDFRIRCTGWTRRRMLLLGRLSITATGGVIHAYFVRVNFENEFQNSIN